MKYIIILFLLTLLNCEWDGIDISEIHGPDVDFDKVKADLKNFVILRAGIGNSTDIYFELNYKKAKEAGMNVGVYWYSKALTETESKIEAQLCLNATSGKKLEYPIFYDIEQKEILAKGKTFCSAIAFTFCSIMESNQKFCGIYSSKIYFDAYFTDKVKKKLAIWVAQYNTRCTYMGKYYMWKNSKKGNVNGINGNVDLDISFRDFPSIMKTNHLNGY